MTRVQIMLVCLLLGSLGLCSETLPSFPDPSVNPYQHIAEANAFRLQPPALKPPDSPPRSPLPRVTLAGITTILGKRVLLKLQFPANPSEPAREQSYILAEGQRDGPIEVVEINERTGSVKLRLSDTDLVLTFERDGPKPSSSPPPRPPLPLPPLPVTRR